MKGLMILLIAGAAMSACTSGAVDSSEFIAWYADSDLIKVKTTRYVSITSKYLPAQLIALRESRADRELTLDDMDSVVSFYDSATYFEVKIEALPGERVNLLQTDAQSYAEYADRMNTLHFSAAQFFSLHTNDESYRPLLCHFESASELSNSITFQLAFPKIKMSTTENITLTFEDPYWHSGINHFQYAQKDIAHQPKVLFQ